MKERLRTMARLRPFGTTLIDLESILYIRFGAERATIQFNTGISLELEGEEKQELYKYFFPSASSSEGGLTDVETWI
jgi:hypothetical protein